MDLMSLSVDSLEQFVENLSPRITSGRSIEECAGVLTNALFNECRFGGGKKSSLVLSRLYLSLTHSDLPEDVKVFVREKFGLSPAAKDLFLTLMGTTGVEPAWCDRHKSQGHQAIPLNHETVKSVPMLARCFQQIGFDLDIVLKGESGIILDGVQSSFGVFHVEEALNSPYVPAQEPFVKPYGVRTVVGSGTMLPNGAVSVWIGFTNLSISSDSLYPLVRLMPSFWHKCYSLYRARSFFG